MAGRGLRASRRGVVRVRVRCEPGIRDCAGFLRLADRRGRAIARGRKLALARGTSKVYRLRLGPRNRAALRAPGAPAGAGRGAHALAVGHGAQREPRHRGQAPLRG